MASVQRLLATTVLARIHADLTAAIARELWRLAHQARAKISHYKRRGDPPPYHRRP